MKIYDPLPEMQALLAIGVLVGLFVTVEMQLIIVSSIEPSSPIINRSVTGTKVKSA